MTEASATKWRNVVAMGVSPWNQNPQHAISPEGTTGNPTQPIHVAPSGLVDCVCPRIHGFTPMATACRPFGTNVLTPGRYVGAKETEGGVPIVRVNNIRNRRIDTNDVKRVAPGVAEKFGRSCLRGGEVLLTLVGTLGEVGIVPPELEGWNVARAVEELGEF